MTVNAMVTSFRRKRLMVHRNHIVNSKTLTVTLDVTWR